jgi:hypothetical protein
VDRMLGRKRQNIPILTGAVAVRTHTVTSKHASSFFSLEYLPSSS